MDNSYAMAKFRLESKDLLRSQQKGCWYYLKYFFFFTSIIQFLIILGLVLFMLYGNAHVGTEDRLKSVESRYQTLTAEHNLLNGNFTLLKNKLASVMKQEQNCSNIFAVTNEKLKNCTKSCLIRPPSTPPADACRALYMLNLTCSNEKLILKNNYMILEREFEKLRDNCTKMTALLSTKVQEASTEKETAKKDTIDLQVQLQQLQTSCTSINEMFIQELQPLRNMLETAMVEHPYEFTISSRCQTLYNTITTNIDVAINRMRQDVNTYLYENSKLKASNTRVNEDLKQCSADKGVINEEKNKLIIEKGKLEKELAEKTENLKTTLIEFFKKTTDLDNCQKMIQSRSLGFPTRL